jgi:hypothetical protein
MKSTIFTVPIMIQKKKIEVDIVKEILEAAKQAYPSNEFVHSLAFQYEERGGLSKKQLEGLYKKAEKIINLPPNWLATLDAVIKKRPTRYKSKLPEAKPMYEQEDESIGLQIAGILAKYPQHKRVLFFKAKYDNKEKLNAAELSELQKFVKLLSSK